MTLENIMSRLAELFCDIFDDDLMQIDRSTTAENIDAWDSLVHINLIVAIEKEFQIKFALGEIQDLKNVGDLVDAITKKSI